MNDLTLSGDLHLVNKRNVPEPDLDQLNHRMITYLPE
jgi:hypothetical protein